MLNEDQLNKLPARLESRINSVFNQFLKKAGQRIKEIGQLSATDIHRLTLMNQANKDIDDILQGDFKANIEINISFRVRI